MRSKTINYIVLYADRSKSNFLELCILRPLTCLLLQTGLIRCIETAGGHRGTEFATGLLWLTLGYLYLVVCTSYVPKYARVLFCLHSILHKAMRDS